MTENQRQELSRLVHDVEQLASSVSRLHDETKYEDLEHARLALGIARHALEETIEQRGLGGHIQRTPDSSAKDQADSLSARVNDLCKDGAALLGEHPSDDLDAAVTALWLAAGSLEEVAESFSQP